MLPHCQSVSALKQHHILHVLGVWEHIHWLYCHHAIVLVKQLQIACLGGRIATHIDHLARCGKEDDIYHIGMHAGTWRVGDNHIGTTMTLDELAVENVLHVAGIEDGVVYAIELGVDLGILDGLGYIFDAYHQACLTGYKVGNGAGAGVEVIYEFVSCERSKVACYLI